MLPMITALTGGLLAAVVIRGDESFRHHITVFCEYDVMSEKNAFSCNSLKAVINCFDKACWHCEILLCF